MPPAQDLGRKVAMKSHMRLGCCDMALSCYTAWLSCRLIYDLSWSSYQEHDSKGAIIPRNRRGGCVIAACLYIFVARLRDEFTAQPYRVAAQLRAVPTQPHVICLFMAARRPMGLKPKA